MATHHITSDRGAFTHPDAPGLPGEPGLLAAIDATPKGEPIVLMVHGYRYSPLKGAGANPHNTLYAATNASTHWKITSWPDGLGLGGDYGLTIGYGWDAACRSRNPRGDLWALYLRAWDEGKALARLIQFITTYAPDRTVDIVAHSMGARVALTAIQHLDTPSIRRVILMGATEYADVAANALDSQAGRFAQIFNITAHQNRMYDMLFRLSGPLPRLSDRLLNTGLPNPRTNWTDICIDAPSTERTLSEFGIALAPAKPGFCHWSFYTRAGVFTLYRRILNSHPSTLAELRQRLAGAEYDGTLQGVQGTIWQAAYTFCRWAYSSSSNP